MRFRRKPIIVDAVRWNGSNVQEVTEFLVGLGERHVADRVPGSSRTIAHFDFTTSQSRVLIETRRGDVVAEPGDWIVSEGDGIYRACKPDAFASAYEVVS